MFNIKRVSDRIMLLKIIVGQTKYITMIATTGGTFVCTPTLLNGGTTLTFAQDGDACTLLYTDATNVGVWLVIMELF